MFGLGMGELMVILFIVLILFGANSLPEIAKGLGRSVREFKKAATEIKSSIDVEASINDPKEQDAAQDSQRSRA